MTVSASTRSAPGLALPERIERLIVCRNPLLAAERQRKRDELLAATDKELEPIVAATRRNNQPLRGAADIGIRVGKVINRYKMAKHFVTDITDERFTYRRNEEKIAAEEQLDGIYIVRSNGRFSGWRPGETTGRRLRSSGLHRDRCCT